MKQIKNHSIGRNGFVQLKRLILLKLMIRRLLPFIVVLVTGLQASAQDTQFSQYYNAPLYLNPAFAGTGMDTRIGLNYRLQWPGLGSPFKTYSLWADHNLVAANSGVGLLLKRDADGKSGIHSNEIAALYSYQVNFNDEWAMRGGLQLGIGTRSIEFYDLTFGDQLTNTGVSGNASTDNIIASGRNVLYPDFAAGGLLYSSTIWIGLSVHHLNNPNQSFVKTDPSALPSKVSFQAGYKINMLPKRLARKKDAPTRLIIPTFNYKHQGGFDQFDLGVYSLWEPVMVGLMYRGIPVKTYSGFGNNEALILLVGMHYKDITVGYSYDLTLSNLSLKNSAGVHEISITYEFLANPKNLRRKRGPIPCPTFERRYQ